MLFLVIFSLLNSLYGDVISNGAYIIVGIVGFIIWGRDGEKPITECSMRERVVYTSLIVALTVAVYLVLNKTQDPLPLIDAFTTVSGIVATYYMLTKKLDAWIIWFVNDIAYIVEYYLIPERARYLLLLNVVFAAMAVASFIEWKIIMKKQKAKEEASFFVIE
jgi:nicotinamide mononucleotide transporter PnuC